MKSLLLRLTHKGLRRVDIPDDAEFTFGLVAPGSKYAGHNGWAVRVYSPGTAKTRKQLAVFTEVMEAWIADDTQVYSALIGSNGEPMVINPDLFDEITNTTGIEKLIASNSTEEIDREVSELGF